MKLAISNIAWTPQEADRVYPILEEVGARGLEFAPGLLFAGEDDPFKPSAVTLRALRDTLNAHGLSLVSMQSLLFGVQGAKLFGTAQERRAIVAGLERAIALAAMTATLNMVMGSPGNRVVPAGMARQETEEIAADVFRRLGDKAAEAGVKIALEPNPSAYRTNFLNTLGETAAFAALVDHPSVTVNFDIGALHMNGEFGEGGRLFESAASLVSHVHVSEPQLAPAPADEAAFGALAGKLLSSGYRGWFSIEMRQVGEHNLETVRSSLLRCARALGGKQ